jgi:streptogramin lyase
MASGARAGRRLVAVMAAAAFAVAASTAHAETVRTLPPGVLFSDLAVTPANEVWYATGGPGPHDVRVQRLQPGGPVYKTGAADGLSPVLTARPDGRIWLLVDGRMVLRSQPDGTMRGISSTIPISGHGYSVTAAGDASLLVTQFTDGFVRVAPDGTSAVRTFTTPAAPPGIGAECRAWDIASSVDGSVWISDQECRRIIHVLPDGTAQNLLLRANSDGTPEAPANLLAAPDGTLWVRTSADDHPAVERLAGGAAQQLLLPATANPSRWALAPDGSVWLADSHACTLWHLSAAGVERRPAPFPDAVPQVAPDGTLWLLGATRLEHVSPAALKAPAQCDTTPADIKWPDVRSTPTGTDRTTLRALRRAGGIRVRATEPATVFGQVEVAGSKIAIQTAVGRRPRAIALSSDVLSTIARRVRRGARTTLTLGIHVRDAAGNELFMGDEIRVGR